MFLYEFTITLLSFTIHPVKVAIQVMTGGQVKTYRRKITLSLSNSAKQLGTSITLSNIVTTFTCHIIVTIFIMLFFFFLGGYLVGSPGLKSGYLQGVKLKPEPTLVMADSVVPRPSLCNMSYDRNIAAQLSGPEFN